MKTNAKMQTTVSLDKEQNVAALSSPIVVEKPRRHLGCGCFLWLVAVLVLIGIGGGIFWLTMHEKEQAHVSTRLAELVQDTPLAFLRHVLGALESKPNVPPINTHPPVPPLSNLSQPALPPLGQATPQSSAPVQETTPSQTTSSALNQETSATPEQTSTTGSHKVTGTIIAVPEGQDFDEDNASSSAQIFEQETQSPQTNTSPAKPSLTAGTFTPSDNPQVSGAIEASPAIPPVQVDERVQPVFINDLANWVVSRYHPGARGGSLSISVQSLNQRYGSKLTGLEAKSLLGDARAAILRYAFTPTMIHGLYNMYADSFLQAIAEQASSPSKKALNERQVRELYTVLGSRCTLLAGGLEGVSALPDLAGRVRSLDQNEDAVTAASAHLMNARFEYEQLREDPHASKEMVIKAKADMELAARNLRSNMEYAAKAQRKLAEDIRRNGASSLNDETLLYLARWVDRRLVRDQAALESVQAATNVLRDLAQRCATAARDGLPAAPAKQEPAVVKDVPMPPNAAGSTSSGPLVLEPPTVSRVPTSAVPSQPLAPSQQSSLPAGIVLPAQEKE